MRSITEIAVPRLGSIPVCHYVAPRRGIAPAGFEGYGATRFANSLGFGFRPRLESSQSSSVVSVRNRRESLLGG
jgi:hypothetical protein